MTGYELDKVFKDSLEFFWQGQTSQIYRELNAMEKNGWLSSEIAVQTGKPNRKIYSITKKGNAEFMKWLIEDEKAVLESIQIRSSFLMKLFFSGELKEQQIAAIIQTFRDGCRTALEKMNILPGNIKKYGKKIQQPKAATSWNMVALFGKSYYEACEKWATKMLEEKAPKNPSIKNVSRETFMKPL